jgi:hypothetical protein
MVIKTSEVHMGGYKACHYPNLFTCGRTLWSLRDEEGAHFAQKFV